MINENDIIISKLKRVDTILDKVFGDRLSKIAEIDAKRIRISKVINTDEKILSNSPDLQLIMLIQNTYKEINGNPLLFLRSLRAKKEWINSLDSELANNLLYQLGRTEIEFGNKESFKILIDIYIILVKNDKHYIIGFLKTPPHTAEFKNSLENIKNKKIANKIKNVILALTNEELDYMIKYNEEINSWENKEAITEDVQFFSAKINSFLYGRDENYLGISFYFKDGELEQTILKNHAYLQLTRYNLQLLYLKKIAKKIESYKTGDWSQFNDFYGNIKKIAGTFIREFGNENVAEWLLKGKDGIREYPQRWFQEINQKILEVSSVQYRKVNVIVPFIKEMKRIFNLRIHELTNKISPEIDDLKEALKPLIKLEKDSASNIISEIAKYRNGIKKRLEKIKKDFDAISNRCIDSLYNFYKAKTDVIDVGVKPEIKKSLANAKAFNENEKQLLQYITKTAGNDLEATSTDPKRVINLLYGLDKANRAFMNTGYNLRSIVMMLTKEEILRKIDNLNRNLEITEKEFDNLNKFIMEKLIFLIEEEANKQQRGVDYGRSRAA